jgi:hypothetical protein
VLADGRTGSFTIASKEKEREIRLHLLREEVKIQS